MFRVFMTSNSTYYDVEWIFVLTDSLYVSEHFRFQRFGNCENF